MFRKKSPPPYSVRSRQPVGGVTEAFRRNNVIISKKQRETALRQQSVTQRQADRHKAEQRHATRVKAIGAVICILGLFLVYRMNISSVKLETNASSRLSPAQITTYESSLLKAYQQHTIANQAWLLDSQGLSKSVRDQFPEIERIEVTSTAPFGSTLRADIRFRKAVFTWRDVSNAQQFVDKNGILFDKNLDPSVNTSKLTRIEDQSGVVLKTGTSVLTASLVRFVGQLHTKVPPIYGSGATIGRVIIPKSTREVQIQMSGQPYLIKFSSTRVLDEQVGELTTLLGFMRGQKITPAAYIDLRVAHKSFYK